MVPGLLHQLKDYNESLTLEKIEEFFLKRFNARQKKYYTPHKLTWEEVQLFTNFPKEEYENSTGLYILSNGSITGLGGWNLYQEALQQRIKQFKNDNPK